MKKSNKTYILFLAGFVLLNAYQPSLAQHRGDNLAFQGFRNQNDGSVQAMGMGSAFTSVSGDINSMFFNSAGLIGLKNLEVSISTNYFKREWWDNQVYRPNRYFVTLPFYLEKLYIPDPATNGMWDHDVFQDTSYAYNVAIPTMGQDPQSKEAADWTRETSGNGINNVALAYPLNISTHNFVLALAYNRQYDIEDFDRNDTYLVPHIGYKGYEDFTGKVTGTDTLNVDWYEYLRQRSGTMHNFKAALAYEVSKKLNLGLALNYQTGESDDIQTLDKVGYFGLFDENEFFFSYDTVVTKISGKSEFKGINGELGIIFKISRFSLGINITSPYTITRDWAYTYFNADSNGTFNQKISGQDKFEIPATFRFGLSFEPIDQFLFSVDYGFAPYSDAKFKLTRPDSTFRDWPDQQTINFGIRYKATEYLDLLGGYRTITQTFVADGAAFDGKGPKATSWTFGLGLNLDSFGRIDVAYELRNLNYHDAYFSNTNYGVEKFNNLAFAYTYQF